MTAQNERNTPPIPFLSPTMDGGHDATHPGQRARGVVRKVDQDRDGSKGIAGQPNGRTILCAPHAAHHLGSRSLFVLGYHGRRTSDRLQRRLRTDRRLRG